MRVQFNLRKRCMMQAIQMWLDQQPQNEWKVVDITKPELPEFEVIVEDKWQETQTPTP